MPRPHLADGGFYALPNGTRLIAERQLDESWALYTVAQWETGESASWRLTPDGYVAFQGKLTQWRADDLQAVPAAHQRCRYR